MEKEELQAMKPCFEELYLFISIRDDISSSEVRTEKAELQRIFKHLSDITVK